MSAFVAAHETTLLGLLFGTIAKYGFEMSQGVDITRAKVMSHVMMLGLLGTLAEVAADAAHMTAQPRVLISASTALLGAKLVERYLRFADAQAASRLHQDPRA